MGCLKRIYREEKEFDPWKVWRNPDYTTGEAERYDYGFRFYGQALNRWYVIAGYAEKYYYIRKTFLLKHIVFIACCKQKNSNNYRFEQTIKHIKLQKS